jgi:hypothetical protein
MPQEMKFNSDMGIMDAAMFIGYDWVTAVTCFVGHGWRMIYTSDMEDNIFADGYLRSEDLHDEHPIQQGMDAMNAVASEDPLLNGRWRRGGVRNWWYEKVRRRFCPTAIAEC